MPNGAPTFTLRFVFRGLCLFVPDDRTLQSYRVLLPKADPDSTVPPALQECASHFPVLYFPPDNLKGVASLSGLPERKIYLEIGGRAVSIQSVTTSTAQGVSGQLNRVPNINLLYPDLGPVDSGILADFDRLAAKFSFGLGVLDGSRDLFEFNGIEVKVRSIPLPANGTPFEGALARTVILEIPGVSGEVVLSIADLKGGQPEPLTLVPTQSGGSFDDLNITIANICGDGLLDREFNNIDPPGVDYDFAWHYMLCKDAKDKIGAQVPPHRPPVPLPVPIEHSMVTVVHGGGGLPVRCAPAQSNPAV